MTSILNIHPQLHLAIGVHASELQFSTVRLTTRLSRDAAVGSARRGEPIAPKMAVPSFRSVRERSIASRHVLASRMITRIAVTERRAPARDAVGAAERRAPVLIDSALVRERWTRRTTRTEEHVQGRSEIIVRRQIDAAALAPRAPSPVEAPSSQHDARGGESIRTFDAVRAAAWSRTPVPTTVNVEQLTEQVIRQIDSRMIAWRERMGKG
jgi:hypothetical protein